MPIGSQWKVEGQLGDKATVEVGRGSIYLNANGDSGATGMLSPAAARTLADHLRAAADECEAVSS